MERRGRNGKRSRKERSPFCVVAFVDEGDSVAAVPTKWLSRSKDTCMWPPKGFGSYSVKQLVRRLAKPTDEWRVCPCRVLVYADTYGEARQKAAIAEQTSHLDSSEESEDEAVKGHDGVLAMPTLHSGKHVDYHHLNSACNSDVESTPQDTVSHNAALDCAGSSSWNLDSAPHHHADEHAPDGIPIIRTRTPMGASGFLSSQHALGVEGQDGHYIEE
ncbi:uncharacterized protein LOC144118760 [Amblyomma americanum]